MKAIVIHEIGGPEVLQIQESDIPSIENGKVLIKTEAFGLNRSELFTRIGHSKVKVFFPRVLGIECVGTIEDSGTSHYKKGQQIAAIMGGL